MDARYSYPWNYGNQFYTALLTLIIVASSIVWARMAIGPGPKVAGLLGWILITVCCSGFHENRDEAYGRNVRYLARLAEHGADYARHFGKVPASLDDLAHHARPLPNRGDADGDPIWYKRVDDKHFQISDSKFQIMIQFDDGEACLILNRPAGPGSR